MNFVKVLGTIYLRGLKLIKILRFGKGDVQEPFEVSPFGFDAIPEKGMKAIYAQTNGRGESVLIGYLNENRLQTLNPGEIRIYSTDGNGNTAFEIKMLNSGILELGGSSDFVVKFSELESGFNELRDKVNSFINLYNTHIHGVSGTSTIPTTSLETLTSASISGSKVENIKVG